MSSDNGSVPDPKKSKILIQQKSVLLHVICIFFGVFFVVMPAIVISCMVTRKNLLFDTYYAFLLIWLSQTVLCSQVMYRLNSSDTWLVKYFIWITRFSQINFISFNLVGLLNNKSWHIQDLWTFKTRTLKVGYPDSLRPRLKWGELQVCYKHCPWYYCCYC